MDNDRLRRGMTNDDIVDAFSEMNPGAMAACTALLKLGDDAIVVFIFLDSLRIYGSRLFQLYMNICDEDPDKVLTLIKENMMGVSGTAIDDILTAIDSDGKDFNMEPICQTAMQTAQWLTAT